MASIVYEGVKNTAGGSGKLFDGLSFWFSSAVPQRKWLLENALANGATVVPLEKQADVLIVDHARKNAPVGTHSYKYIEQSIRNGALEDLADHIVGPTKSTDRPVGSMSTASKGSKSKYTEAEDQLLWNFVKPYELNGGATGGNEIYKQLEEAHGNGRHTYQSWRNRWLKHVKFSNRRITGNLYAENEEDATQATQQVAQGSPRRHVPMVNTPATSSPRRAAAVTNAQCLLDSPNRSRAVPASSENAETLGYREALQRKLGRKLPSGSSSSNFRDWEQVAVPKRLQDEARTDATFLRPQQASLDTDVPTKDRVPIEQAMVPSQSNAEEPDGEDVLFQSSIGSGEYFTDEDYELLMAAAEHIIREGDQDDESWELLGRNYDYHSSMSWREFWEEKVKPDFLDRQAQIKKEQVSQSNNLEPRALRDIAEHPAEQSDEAASRDEDVEHGTEGPAKGYHHGVVAGKANRLNDGLESLSGTPGSTSPRHSSPFACRWRDCNADVCNLSMLLEHVSSKHKPGRKDVAYGRAYTCQWSGCGKFGVDENGEKIVLDLREPKVWASHFIEEHIGAIRSRYGLGPSDSEGLKGEIRSSSTKRTPMEEVDSEIENISRVATVSPPARSPNQRNKVVQVDGASEDGRHGEEVEDEEVEDEESEEAEETDRASSSDELTNEIVSLRSDEDDDPISNTTPRRSKRLKYIPRPRMTEPTVMNYVDKAVGSSPPASAEDAHDGELNNVSNWSLSPGQSKPPEPNEARKRSAGKGNSQESNQSSNNLQEAIDQDGGGISQQSVMLLPRKRTRELEPGSSNSHQESPDAPASTDFEPTVKRRKQRRGQEESVEIPSTPESRTVLGEIYEGDEEQGSSMFGNSPTPRPRARFGSANNLLSRTPPRRADLQAEDHGPTSPLQRISMFSDIDSKLATSSPARSASTRQDELSSEPDTEFETAPQSAGNLWDTAPSEEPEENAEDKTQYETAPEPKGKGRQRLDTQFLFAQPIPDIEEEEDLFFLAEPEDGWPEGMDNDDGLGGPLTELSIPTSHQPEPAVDANDDDDNDDDDAASIPDIPRWVGECVVEDDSIDAETLVHAINATSGFDEKLIRKVHDFILDRKKHRDPDVLPLNIPGCWTHEDDEALRKGDAPARIRVRQKHGRLGEERRRAWLLLE